MNESEKLVPWQVAAEYVAAGSITRLEFGDDLTTALLEVAYGTLREQRMYTTLFRISCLNYSYIALSRLEHHTPGSGAIYEAYLYEQSHLIEDIVTHRLEAKAGALVLQSNSLNRALRHLEIIGEISLNVVCEEVQVTTTGQFPPDS